MYLREECFINQPSIERIRNQVKAGSHGVGVSGRYTTRDLPALPEYYIAEPKLKEHVGFILFILWKACQLVYEKGKVRNR